MIAAIFTTKTTESTGRGRVLTLDCLGACRTPKGRRRRTRHIVRAVKLDAQPFNETTCCQCLHVSYTDPETGAVVEKVALA
jgi:hypothetical protein